MASAARETAVLTLAAVRSGESGSEYLFNERHRIYRAADAVEKDETARRLIEEAAGKDQPLKVTLDLRRGLILRVTQPSPREIEAFRRLRVPLDKPSKTVPIDVARIDPSVFNFVDIHQKWPVFRLCTRIVPSYAKAKEIFDYCAKLSCHLPGPYAITPCIPFQYVHDGCYARAHQMRRIITTRYRYCCEKVFSFANQGSDNLAVRANKWGGCCVVWWYHVAPLVRVRLRLRLPRHPAISLTLAMVIDPSMFDKPVLLSTWLAAQEEKSCHANANVSMYSIQPGSAYTPANFAGTTFSTDPNYVLTEQTLVAYSGLTTCP